jgi:hypothetical protein
MRVDFMSERQKVTLYDNGGNIVLFSPEEKVYSTIPGAKTIEQTFDNLEKRDISLPLAPYVRNDPYATAIEGIKSAAVIGRVEIGDKVFHHLVFTEQDVDWQMWVEGGEHPTPKRTEIIYKTMPGAPRVTIEFSDWNLQANPSLDTFVFHKPADAHQIEFLKINPKQGG